MTVTNKLSNVDGGKTDIDTELAELKKRWDNGELRCLLFIALETDGGAHMATIPGDCSRFEIMGAAADLAAQVNAQKV